MAGRAGRTQRLLAALERTQQRLDLLAFPVAVFRKSQDDRATSLAALIAYYAFFAIFPLLLVLVTVLGIVLKGNEELQRRIIESAVSQIPVVGSQLVASGGSGIQGHGIGLVVGIVGTFIGARGMARSFRRSTDTVWAVPWYLQGHGVRGFLATLGLLLVVGGGLVATSVISGYVVGTIDIGVSARTGGALLTCLLNVGVFAVSFRLCASRAVPFRSLWVGAVLAAVSWTVLQLVGGLVVTHVISRSSDVYGTFALVIGLLTWLFAAAYATIMSLEVDVVRVNRLWPRTFFVRTTLTEADRRAMASYVHAEQRHPSQRIAVRYDA
ncbi:MAG TPA: YihY/virulence factor BrkB family protein [Actinomycetes bacterium]|nr:YihY/virulence factor BrkB family protein [Actinomycetes bacterium]